MAGKVPASDRAAAIVFAVVGFLAAINGGWMLAQPQSWYSTVPTVALTGPFNEHFVRDIGAAYLASGAMLGWAARYPQGRWLAAAAASLWLALHGAIHLFEVATGVCGTGPFLVAAPGVLGPPIAVLVALFFMFRSGRIAPAGLPKRVVLPTLKRMGDGDYLDELAQAPGQAFEKFLGFLPASAHRHDAPVDQFHAARIGAVLAEDCGACAMICGRAACDDGVPRHVVNRLLAADAPDALRIAFDFGRAIATAAPNAADLGDAIEASHGRSTRLEISMAAALVRGFPGIKRGLGYSRSCGLRDMTL